MPKAKSKSGNRGSEVGSTGLTVTVPSTTPQLVSEDQLAVAQASVNAIAHPVITGANEIAITDAISYESASAYLQKVQGAIKQINNEEPDNIIGSLIRPLRAALDKLYEIRRAALKPLEAAEKIIKEKMVAYKRAEARRIAEEEAKRRAEEERLRQEALRLALEAEAKAREAERLKNKTQAAARLQEAQSLQYHADTTARIADMVKTQQPVITPVKSTSSSSRTIKKWRLRADDKGSVQKSFETLIKHIAKGELPSDMLMLDSKRIGEYYADESYREVMLDYREFEEYDDIVIAGRS